MLFRSKQILQNIPNKKYLFQYLRLCFENVKNNVSSIQSLDCASVIFNIVAKQSKETCIQWVNKFNDEYDLVNLFIENCKKYEGLVKDNSTTTDVSKDINFKTFTGKYNHLFNLRMRFNFLTNILKQGIVMGNDNIAKLCNLYIDDSNLTFDTKHFLDWISWQYEMNDLSIKLNNDEVSFLFDIISKSYSKLLNRFDINYYTCFANNFIIVNTNRNILEYSQNKFKVIKFEDIIGLDQIWDCICQCTEEECRLKFTNLLLKSYTNFHNSVQVDKMNEILKGCIYKCMEKIKSFEDNTLAITNLLKLLIKFLSFYDDKPYVMPISEDTKYTITLIQMSSINLYYLRSYHEGDICDIFSNHRTNKEKSSRTI